MAKSEMASPTLLTVMVTESRFFNRYAIKRLSHKLQDTLVTKLCLVTSVFEAPLRVRPRGRNRL
jgi:hypothetical protein